MANKLIILMIVILGSTASFAQEYNLAYVDVLNDKCENLILIGTPLVRYHEGDTIGFTVNGGNRYTWTSQFNSTSSRRVPEVAEITDEVMKEIALTGVSHITIAGKRKQISQKKSDHIMLMAQYYIEEGLNNCSNSKLKALASK